MKRPYSFLAFDLGATSGRTMLGTLRDGRLTMKELTRFPNKIINVRGKYYWDILALFDAVCEGIRASAAEGVSPDAIGVDTWGVDLVYIGGDGAIIGNPRCYRDPYTGGVMEEYFRIIPKQEVYGITGIQFMEFNSLFQILAAKKEGSSALTAAKHILFMPDALTYMLTGKMVCEYSIASTSQFLNPATGKLDSRLIEAAGANISQFPEMVMPGTVAGSLDPSLAKGCGVGEIPVVAVAGHDTGSAIAAVPASDGNFAYLSSGTWSLMGIEVKEPIINEASFRANFTNEGGVDGTTRFLKNITGMWLLEQCRKEWENDGRSYTYPQITAMAEGTELFLSLVDPDHPSLANPPSMTAAIAKLCRETGQKVPGTDAEYIRCIFDSLALKYKHVLGILRGMAPFGIDKLHVIGGGSQNAPLNQATADATGIPVIAGPCEATAIGNIMLQAMGIGAVKSLAQIREVVRNSVSPDTFTPRDTGKWDSVYEGRFLQLLG